MNSSSEISPFIIQNIGCNSPLPVLPGLDAQHLASSGGFGDVDVDDHISQVKQDIFY
jgi:hypothetical protein